MKIRPRWMGTWVPVLAAFARRSEEMAWNSAGGRKGPRMTSSKKRFVEDPDRSSKSFCAGRLTAS